MLGEVIPLRSVRRRRGWGGFRCGEEFVLFCVCEFDEIVFIMCSIEFKLYVEQFLKCERGNVVVVVVVNHCTECV